MDYEEYLKSQGATSVQEILKDGVLCGYYAKINGGDEIYLPVNNSTSASLDMVSYLPGSGGSTVDASQGLRDKIFNDPPEYMITIANSAGDYHNSLEMGYNIAQGTNRNITNEVTVCFSASGFNGITKTEQLLENHPEINATIISCEPYNTYGHDKNNWTALKENNASIIFVAPDSGFHINMLDYVKDYTDSGLNTYLLETDYTANAHILTNRDVQTSGMIEYILGYQNDFDKTRAGGYDFIRYNSTTKEFEEADYQDMVKGN